jgi:hypothetical protein
MDLPQEIYCSTFHASGRARAHKGTIGDTRVVSTDLKPSTCPHSNTILTPAGNAWKRAKMLLPKFAQIDPLKAHSEEKVKGKYVFQSAFVYLIYV